MKKIFTPILLLFFCFVFAQKNQEKFHRAKIYYSNSEQLNQLRNNGIAIDHGIHKKNTYFESDFSQLEIEKIKLFNLI